MSEAMMFSEEIPEQPQPLAVLGNVAMQEAVRPAEADIAEPDLDEPADVISSDLVRIYLNGIGKKRLLTAAEEVDLAKRIEAGLTSEEVLRLRRLSGRRRKAEAPLAHEMLTEQTYIRLKKKAERSGELSDDDRAQLKSVDAPLAAIRGLKALNRLVGNEAEYPDTDLKALVRSGNRARNELLVANLRLVVSLAKRYTGRGMPLLDLIQEGNLGLIRAVEKFDYRQGFKFSTYATWWIRQSVSRGLADDARTIRIPVHMVEQINKFGRLKRELTQDFGRDPNPDELAAAMNLTVDKVLEIERIGRDPVSLDMNVGDDSDGTLGEFVADEDADDVPAAAYEAGELRDNIDKVLAFLDRRERTIVLMRFGLMDGHEYTLDEIGKEFGMSRERVRQIQKDVINRLRKNPAAAILRDYMS